MGRLRMWQVAAAGGAIYGLMSLSGHGGHIIPADLLSAPSGGQAGCHKLERLWEAAGGSPGAAQMAASIAMAESGGDQYATNHNTDGSTDRGYWQINTVHGSESTYNPMGNAQAAVAISGNGSDWSQWTTYTSGAYAGRC